MIDKILKGEECIFPIDYTLNELKEDIYKHLDILPDLIPLDLYRNETPFDDFIVFEYFNGSEIFQIEFDIEDECVEGWCGCDSDQFCIHMAGVLLLHAKGREDQKYLFKDQPTSMNFVKIENDRATSEAIEEKRIIEKKIKAYGFTYKSDWEKHFKVEKRGNKINVVPKNELMIPVDYLSDLKNAEIFKETVVQLPQSVNKKEKAEYKGAIIWERKYNEIWPSAHLFVGKKKKNGDLGSPIKYISRDSLDYDRYSSRQIILTEELEALAIKVTSFSKDLYQRARGVYSYDMDDLKEAYFMMTALFDDMFKYPQYINNKIASLEYLKISDISPLTYQKKEELTFNFSVKNGFCTLKPKVHLLGKVYDIDEIICFGMVRVEDFLVSLTLDEALVLLSIRNPKGIRIKEEFKEDIFPTVLEIQKKFRVKYLGVKIQQTSEELLLKKKKVYLTEEDDFLLLKPSIQYHHSKIGEKEYGLDNNKVDIIHLKNNEVFNAKRNVTEEEKFSTLINNLHPSFTFQENFFKYVHANDVMKEQWFIKMYAQLEEEGVEILGRKALKKIRLNPHTPHTRLTASSGMDWFDLKMEINFGDQHVKIADVRKAIVNREDYVKLGDGSIGFLPQEWIEKYSNLLKLGKIRKDSVRISAYQPSLIDEMYDEMQNKEVFDEILKKQRNLKNFRSMPNLPIPEKVNATLRPYQEEGFKWLTFLDDIQWGGCLADDMGLGKTLQVLSFLQHLKDTNQNKNKLPHLIVVPRSLIFNWQHEAEKFCKELTILDNSKIDRTKDIKEFKNYDAIIMTYAMVRMDIEHLKKAKFHYVVLDESQAIKNPLAQVSKAVKLLKAQNRIVMTGTPVENNTFDLFSQMDFLNPGMLGTVKSFKEQYADQIDKKRDQATAEELRKMIYPFMLRRKKNEVAKDLPSKVEQVLYCEMEPKQRKIYDKHKNEIRNKLIEIMDSEEAHKTGMYIVQGLMKLRQICNSPTLLSNDENGEYPSDSAKLSLLINQVKELSAEGHKVLVFSFFVEMLELIAKELETENIGFNKLLGGSTNREKLVQDFKENDDKKVFLISLKAGGFGLNLTEASYVFLVDPWWNPAVEQQAIDRTHRIGQENPVFAYKMICKDSIEEKILEIQEKKKAVADDVISTESSLFKNVTKEDIKILFE